MAIDAVSSVFRLLPQRMPGKARLARLAAASFGDVRLASISDRFGNRLTVPSLREPIALGLFAAGVYEPDTLSAILRCLPERGVFVDVGANIGAISLPVASLRPEARSIAVEADPRIAAILRTNVENNRRHNVTVVECIAGPEEARVTFYRAPDQHFGMGSIGGQFAPSQETLPQRPLDDVLDDLAIGDIDVVKLDIEGAEAGALRGLARRLRSEHAPVLIFEFADWAETRIGGQHAGDAQRFILSFGYTLSIIRCGRSPEKLGEPVTAGAAMILATPPTSRD